MDIDIKLFATLRDYGPKGLEIGESFPMNLDESATVKTILQNLGISEDQAKIVMVNGVIINDHNHKLKTNDLISIFPPVGGGVKQLFK